jgi:hypothetical protein
MPDDTEQDRQTRCCQEDHHESHARKAVQGDIAPSTKARALGKFVAA